MADQDRGELSSVVNRFEKSEEKLPAIGAVIREFFIDFLGSLLPGLFFMLLASPLVIWGGLLFWGYLANLTGVHPASLENLSVPNSFRAEAMFALLILSYILGSVFFRQDPKIPDQASAEYILKKMPANELPRSAIQPRPLEYRPLTASEAYSLARSEGAQFPYSNLYDYLQSRGLTHLSECIRWGTNAPKTQDNSKTTNFRSKMFINILKIRLQYVAPGKCAEVIRNEAQIRMMSSIWYATRAFKKLATLVLAVVVSLFASQWAIRQGVNDIFCLFAIPFLAIGLNVIVKLIPKTRPKILNFISKQPKRNWAEWLQSAADFMYFPSVAGISYAGYWVATTKRVLPEIFGLGVLALVLFTLAELIQRRIRAFFHYQRVREIVYVLETAWIAAQNGHPEILKNLPGDDVGSEPFRGGSPKSKDGHATGASAVG